MVSFTGFYGCAFGLAFARMSYDDFKEAYKHFTAGSCSNKSSAESVNLLLSIPKVDLYAGIAHTARAVTMAALSYFSFSFIISELKTSNLKASLTQLEIKR